MKVHHLNCGCMCPLGGALMDGESKGLRGKLVCHCLLVETNAGLVLVDTGFGTEDARNPHKRLAEMFVYMNQPQRDPACTALAEVQRVGFKASDVRHIVLTHLDFDHAGGISEFPNAVVHLTRREAEAGERRHGVVGKGRYRPMQWTGVERWKRYVPQGERWFGFDAVRQLDGLPPEILLVPLRGHTEGHAGVAVRADDGRWLFNAGDAYFWRDEVRRPDRKCTPGLEAYQTMMEVDRPARLRNQQRVRELSLDHASEVTVFCSHDPSEYRLLSGRTPQSSVA